MEVRQFSITVQGDRVHANGLSRPINEEIAGAIHELLTVLPATILFEGSGIHRAEITIDIPGWEVSKENRKAIEDRHKFNSFYKSIRFI
ncbi:hypothetical protein [Bhargavaea beijingensis]|uniref:hypothetical protein n=1 Tax=Bhargavaea beijingensis TaxID=426756 RepID=UPI002224BBC3|nr:hypothetical protein [Bhargavaea beijingensis]MCW1926959.1 hypothetical protein [Bhargavaea beijingensis]